MRLTLAEHRIDELTVVTGTELQGSRLRVDLEELHAYLLEDRRLDEIARERGTDPVDVALDLTLEFGREVRFRIPLANNIEEGVAELLNDPNTTIGLSDAGAAGSNNLR